MANQVGMTYKQILQKARDFKKMITKDSLKTTHADNVRKADDMVANVLQNISSRLKYPELTNEATLKKCSESIKPEC
jgi:hypothetical protein